MSCEPKPYRRPGRPTDERREPYHLSLRPSTIERVDAVAESECNGSRSHAAERLILEALAARDGTGA